MDCAQQLHATIYLALVVECATQTCFLACHDTKEFPKRWKMPLVLFMCTLQSPKSKSL